VLEWRRRPRDRARQADEQERRARRRQKRLQARAILVRRHPLLVVNGGDVEPHGERRPGHIARAVQVHWSGPAVFRLVERPHQRLQHAVGSQRVGPLRDRRHQGCVIDPLVFGEAIDGLTVGENDDGRPFQEGARHTVDDRGRAGPERG
jgi:hypothetical protein